MKVSAKILLCFIVLTVGRLAAQETFAPLVTENCVAFVHVDFSKVEIDRVKTVVQKAGEDVLRGLGFDDSSFKATAKELRAELDKLDAVVRPAFETVTKELGIREFAIIADMDLIDRDVPAIIAIPWKDKTEQQFVTLRNLLNLDATVDFFGTGGLLTLPLADKSTALTDWLAEKEPSSNAVVFDALKNVAGDEIKVAVAIPEKIRLMARAGGMPPEIPNEIKGLLLFATQKIQWISASLSLNELLGEKSAKNSDVFLTLKTPKRSDAVQLRGMLEQAIEFGINAARFAMEQDQSMEFQPPPLFFSFLKGFLRTLLPDVEDDMLKFRLKGDLAGLQQGPAVVAASGVGAALLLPAAQAARKAAVRTQCSNNIRQILLAFHNYHDTMVALPPLYSVDKNGKPLHSWRVLILPYIEQMALYEQIRLDEPWDSEYNKQFHNTIVSVYRCPDNVNVKGKSNCTYSVIAGEGIVPGSKEKPKLGHTFAAIADGTSNTIAVVEVKEPFCWMDPTADIDLATLAKGINAKDGRCGSFHPGGCNIGMFDGSVRFWPQATDAKVLRAFGTRAGGESVPFP